MVDNNLCFREKKYVLSYYFLPCALPHMYPGKQVPVKTIYFAFLFGTVFIILPSRLATAGYDTLRP